MTETSTNLPRRKLLRNGLLAASAFAGASLVSEAVTSKAWASFAPNSPQSGWIFCELCRELFFVQNEQSSHCANNRYSGGTGNHIFGTSYDYALDYGDTVSESNPQSDWAWCGNCQGLFYSPHQSTSHCPIGGSSSGPGNARHVVGMPSKGVGSFNYALYTTNVNGGQPQWYWCSKCQGLFYGGTNQAPSVCPKDFAAHDGSSSDNYHLFYVSTSP